MDSVEFDIPAPLVPEITNIALPETVISPSAKAGTRVTKDAIRTSLRASTVDSAFAAVYTITTTGILLSNFLVELHASPVAIGMLTVNPNVGKSDSASRCISFRTHHKPLPLFSLD
jgi:hypothetical protein